MPKSFEIVYFVDIFCVCQINNIKLKRMLQASGFELLGAVMVQIKLRGQKDDLEV